MREEAFSNAERSFVSEALKSKLRVDGRGLDEARETRIRLRKANGSAEVTIGSTRAVATVSVEAVPPFPDRPSDGMISFSVEFSPAASERFAFELGAMGMSTGSTEETTILTRAVERSIRESRALDTESLCILAGKLVWSLRVDVQVVDYCGNALDAAELVSITALKHAHRPDVTVAGTDVTIHPTTHREPVPLPVHHVPIATSFVLMEDGAAALIDPCLQEEQAMEGRLTVVVNAHGEICGVQKAGGASIQPDLMLRCVKLATKRSTKVTKLLGDVLLDASVRVPMKGAMPEVPAAGTVVKYDVDNTNGSLAEPTESLEQMKIDVTFTNEGDKSSRKEVSWRPPPPSRGSDEAVASSARPDAPRPPPPTIASGGAKMVLKEPSRMIANVDTNTNGNKGPQTTRHGGNKDDEEDEVDEDDDDDLMSAVISRPRGGGGGRKSRPKAKPLR